jgi:hypothetical protein
MTSMNETFEYLGTLNLQTLIKREKFDIFQTEERKMLMVLDAFLTFKGRYMGVFIHDGGLVEKLEGETKFPEELLIEKFKNILVTT